MTTSSLTGRAGEGLFTFHFFTFMASDKEVYQAMTTGIKFGGAKKERPEDANKVKTKARVKSYKTGAHKSGAAKHKAEIRQRVKNRASQRKNK